MGKITSIIRGGMRAVDIGRTVSSGLNAVGYDVPKLDVPEGLKSYKPNFNAESIKLPAGVDSYISPVVSKAISGFSLPTSIGGVSLPKMPDLSSVASEVDHKLSSLGFDTSKLGIRSVNDILANPDLSALKNVEFASPVDLNNMPDLSKAMDGFDLSEAQSQVDSIMNSIPSITGFDISKYF